MSPGSPKLVFLYPSASSADLDRLRNLDLDRDGREFVTGESCWSLETYHVLRRQGWNAVLTNQYDPEGINFAHPTLIRMLPAQRGVFLVSLQADYPSCPIAQLHIVQNLTQVVTGTSEWMPHWSMPGLIPRLPERTEIQNVGYTGIGLHLVDGEERWKSEMSSVGLSFIRVPKKSCHNLSQIDVLIGVRNFDDRTWDNRPAWKMTNAWSAGIPFIAGVDSAYSQVGRPGIDHLVARSWDDVHRHLQQLREDPALYHSLVAAGHQIYRQYDHSAVAQVWEQRIQDWMIPAFEQWQLQGGHGFQEFCRVHYWNCTRSIRRLARRILHRRKPSS